MAGPRQLVDPPSFTPTPYGLLTTVEFPPANDDHWLNGITYQPMCDSGGVAGHLGASTYDPCTAVTGTGSPPTAANLAKTVNVTSRGATAFTVYTEFDCATVGNDQAQETAERAMAMSEPWQVENAFWAGVAGNQSVVFPHLAANAQVLDANGILLQSAAVNVTGVSGDLLNIETALGLLEGALANCYGGVGVIHVPTLAVPTLDAWGIIKANGAVMKTANGNKVAIGEGYPGTGPDGSSRSGNSCWIYATGNVFGYRTDVKFYGRGAQVIDRSTNTIKMIAQRTYVLGWDCCHFAVQATLGVPKGT